MAETLKQYKITITYIAKFEHSIKAQIEKPHDDPLIQKAIVDGMESVLSDLRREIMEFESKYKIEEKPDESPFL